MVDEKKNEVNLGPVEKIPLGQGFCFLLEGKEVAVFRPRSGGLFAVQNRCPHRQGPLAEGLVDSENVVCPYHAHKFNLCTGAGTEPGERVKVYSIKEENGEIVIGL
jgi:nitrite reductase (NADH) small subunit